MATAYLGLIPAHLDPALPDDTAWHPVDALPETAFDHGSIVGSALARLRAKLSYTNVGFALAPPAFTIAELRVVYVAALGYEVTATNLQRVLLRRGVLEPTGEMAPPGRAGGRPAMLYRFAVADAGGHRPVRGAPATRDAGRVLTAPGAAQLRGSWCLRDRRSPNFAEVGLRRPWGPHLAESLRFPGGWPAVRGSPSCCRRGGVTARTTGGDREP